MLTLYDSKLSGNGWKVRLLLSRLAIPFERRILSPSRGDTRSSEFLEKSPAGRIPVVVLDSGDRIFESNAILVYFAEATELYASDRLDRARVLQWLFFEQFELGPNIALPRYYCTIVRDRENRESEMRWLHERGYRAFDTMERHLNTQAFFALERYTIADIALYPYVKLSHEGEYDLGRFPAIRDWLARIEQEPGYVPLLTDAAL